MAKPIGNGKGGNSQSNDRSQWVNGVLNDDEDTWVGTKQNDFFYIDPTLGYSEEVSFYGNLIFETELLFGPEDPLLPFIDGTGGADQIIMMEDAVIFDSFFTNIFNVEVLKLYDGEESFAFLGAEAQKTGIKEVTGGSGNDFIVFGEIDDDEWIFGEWIFGPGYVEPDDYDSTENPLEITIRGGAGADIMVASFGDDTFLWKAGDLDGTDEDDFDTIYNFTIGDDVLDILELGVYGWTAVKIGDDTLIKVDTTDDYEVNYDTNLVLLVGVDYDNFIAESGAVVL